jgi:hypothetical protein
MDTFLYIAGILGTVACLGVLVIDIWVIFLAKKMFSEMEREDTENAD